MISLLIVRWGSGTGLKVFSGPGKPDAQSYGKSNGTVVQLIIMYLLN